MNCPNCGPGHQLAKIKVFGMKAKICIQNDGCGRWWTGKPYKMIEPLSWRISHWFHNLLRKFQ